MGASAAGAQPENSLGQPVKFHIQELMFPLECLQGRNVYSCSVCVKTMAVVFKHDFKGIHVFSGAIRVFNKGFIVLHVGSALQGNMVPVSH